MPKQILFYEPGIAVTSLEAADANAVKTKLAIAPDCRLGLHAAARADGQRHQQSAHVHVGALPEIKEVEPNSDFAQPQKIALDTTVNGVVENEDVDYFAIEAKKGERITAEIEGLRLGNYVLRSLCGHSRHAAVRAGPLRRCRRCCGKIALRRSSRRRTARTSSRCARRRIGGNGSCMYRLHVGRFPRPTAVLPAGGKPGETMEVDWLGDVAGERDETDHAARRAARRIRHLRPRRAWHCPFGQCRFAWSISNNVLEVEPNNAAADGHAVRTRRWPPTA